jgi:exosortase
MSTLVPHSAALKRITPRWVFPASWVFLSLLLFARPLKSLVRLSLSKDDISYIVVIPFFALGILLLERHQIFQTLRHDNYSGAAFLVLAGLLAILGHSSQSSSIDHLQLAEYILSLALFWVAGFAFFYGRAALKAASFPLVFLLLAVPPPDFVLDHVVYFLQEGSAWITAVLFDLFNVPFLREGFVFHLSRVDIEVAKECSGIRSSMALLVLALLIAHFQLRSFPAKLIFVVCGLFLMILKNGIRITTLTLLAMYVDPSFLTGRLHHQGGVVFFLLGLLLLWPILGLLKRGESRWQAKQTFKVSQGSTT